MHKDSDPAGLTPSPDPDAADTPVAGRRRFLITSLASLPAAALAGCDKTGTPSPPPAAGSAPAATADAGSFQPKFFNDKEWAFIRAAVDRLIPHDAEGPGALELGVANFIDNQMEGAFGHAANWYMQGPFKSDAPALFGYQKPLPPRELYRAGIAAVDAHCTQQFGAPFAQLDHARQEQLLHEMDEGKLQFDAVSAQEFFGFLWQNTKEGYLADPLYGGNKNRAAWDMIGFPGARADYLDWVAQPGKKYPFPAVDIAGRQT
ncbi:MAG: gluconate 2-dehydrogenase subunit 3 family protein [Rhodocyclaceae bacterium]